jgi:cardiolipin synthase
MSFPYRSAKSGVQVQVTMTSYGSYNSEFTTLKAAGVKVSTYTETAPLYIHAKVILVDYGASWAAGVCGLGELLERFADGES